MADRYIDPCWSSCSRYISSVVKPYYSIASVKVQFSCLPIGQNHITVRQTSCSLHASKWRGGNRSTTIIDRSIIKPEVRHKLLVPTSKGKAKFFQEFQHISLWHLLYNKTLIYWDLWKTVPFVAPRPLLFGGHTVTGPQNTLFPSISVNKATICCILVSHLGLHLKLMRAGHCHYLPDFPSP